MLMNRAIWSLRVVSVVTVALICASSPTLGKTITVGHSGCNYSSVQQAINAAEYGDHVVVHEGTYNESLRLKLGVFVRASDNEEVVVRCSTGHVVEAVNVMWGGLSGFTIQYTGTSNSCAIYLSDSDVAISYNVIKGGLHGICIDGDGSPVILDNIIQDNREVGIRVWGTATGRIDGNSILLNGSLGICVFEDASPIVVRNDIYDNGSSGVDVRGASSPWVTNNQIYENGNLGVGISGSASPKVEDNTIAENAKSGIAAFDNAEGSIRGNSIYGNGGSGVSLYDNACLEMESNAMSTNTFAGICVNDASSGIFRSNEIFGNGGGGGIGVWINDDSAPTVTGNTVRNHSGVGIEITDTAVPLIRDNEVCDNGTGIWISGYADPRIEWNVIADNSGHGVVIAQQGQGDIQNNEVHSNGLSGFFVFSDANPTIENNTIHSNSLSGITIEDAATGLISNNVIRGNAHTGVWVQDRANPTIRSNAISDNTEYGIWVQDEALPRIEDNELVGNGKGAVSVRGSEPPQIAAIDSPAVAPATPNGIVVSIAFHDIGADLRAARFEVLAGDLDGFTIDLTQPPYAEQVMGAADGEVGITIAVAEPGSYTLRVTLVDSVDLESVPAEFTFQTFAAHSPVVVEVLTPEMMVIQEGMSGLVRWEDSDGDITQASFEVLDGSLDDFTLDLTQAPYAEQVVGLAEGEFSFEIAPTEPDSYRIQVTLVDATGLESEPFEFSFEAYTPTPPLVDRITFPGSIGVDEGQNGLIRFEDPEGDIVEARFEVIEGDPSTIEIDPGLSFDPEIAGETDGAFRFTVRVTEAQTVTLRLILVDATGLESEPVEFTFTVE